MHFALFQLLAYTYSRTSTSSVLSLYLNNLKSNRMNTQNTLKPGPKLELVVKDLQNFALFKLDGSEKSQAQKLVLLQAACVVLSEKVSLGDFFRQFKRG